MREGSFTTTLLVRLQERFPGAQIAPEDMVADSRQDLLTSVLAKPVSGSIGVLNPTGPCQGRELSLDP
jgi:hypothetical protein